MVVPTPKACDKETSSAPAGPEEIPEMMLRSGRVQVPGPDGPVALRVASGGVPDVFEVADQLVGEFGRLYLVDLDGIEHADPQLDYIQELSRNTDLWVDAGVRRGEEVADLLIAGARRVVVSTSTIRSIEELRRGWRLSTALVVELDLVGGKVHARSRDWEGADPGTVAGAVRAEGIPDLIVSPRGEAAVDWGLVAGLARAGPVWVDGTYSREQANELGRSGARGGIFHPTFGESAPPLGAAPP